MNVMIPGARIAGLSLALRLHQRSLPPIISERSPRLRDGGYMLMHALGLASPSTGASSTPPLAGAPDTGRGIVTCSREVPWCCIGC
ncbi:hypothetical protein [Siccirubricoccus deserti]|uniref:FAD-binding domain-containing protein n=1 Tax=Siccirubricoccus deserti TaxID=2013562 RepID=A0A9X0R692_9PROT|nr:hypothetical protein [Siccirubricoccus deserti]MBC4019323.1 hypothetical protein [Siccirubricoccus deserti]